MKNILRISAAALPLASLLIAGCPDNNNTADAFTPPMPDAFTPDMPDAFNPDMPDAFSPPDAFVPTDAPVVITNDCAGYCTQIGLNCTGDNAQYVDTADCMAQCTALAWPAGTPGASDGNTIACRIYHAGAPAAGDPGAHCPHAGASGAGVCGAPIAFRSDASSGATRVDRMGMPAVATAAISSGMKNAYNDADPATDAMLAFAGDEIASITGLHAALDDDLVAAGLTACSMTTMVDVGGGMMLPQCLGQPILGPGSPRVYQLVIPDTLLVNPGQVQRFPNGRAPNDVVMDVTLAAVLLDLSTHSAGTLAMIPVNPISNAAGEITDTFPYLGTPTPFTP